MEVEERVSNVIIFKLKKGQGRWDTPAPLTWWPVTQDGKTIPIVVCGNGHYAYLDHDIADDGVISPSLVCSEYGCDFHVFGKLEGWRK